MHELHVGVERLNENTSIPANGHERRSAMADVRRGSDVSTFRGHTVSIDKPIRSGTVLRSVAYRSRSHERVGGFEVMGVDNSERLSTA